MTNKTINPIGIAAIHAFLAKRSARYYTSEMIGAWATEAEFQLAEGRPASIELSAWDSVSGHVEEFTVPDSGIASQVS